MTFDVNGAKQAGYSDKEIADHLAKENNFDAAAARKSGYSDDEIISHLNESKNPPKVTAGGLVGSAIRGMAPIAAGTTLGAAAGAPFGGIGAIPGAAAGALTTSIEELGGNLYNVVAPHVGAPHFKTFGERIGEGLDVLNVERPDTQLERIVEAGAGGAAGAGAAARSFSQLAPNIANPVAKNVVTVLAKQPVRQTVAGGLAGATTQTGLEAGLSPIAANLVGLAAGGVPFMGRGSGALPQTQRSIQSGYSIPPVMASKKPSMFANILSKIGGEEKIERNATVNNQEITNKLVKKELGIPEDSVLTRDVVQKTRKENGRIYEDVKNVPGTSVDSIFTSDVNNIIAPINALANNFPKIVKNDQVKELVDSLNNAASGSYDSASSVDLSKVLRQKAVKNIMSDRDDLEELGHAQKAAADAIENLLTRRIMRASSVPNLTGIKISPDLAIRWNEARTKIAQAHVVEEALNPATGNVDAKKLGRVIDKNAAKLTGGLKIAGETALAFPRIVGTPEKMSPFSRGDLASMIARAAPGAAVGYGLESPALGAAITTAGTVAAPVARGIALSKAYQNALRVSTPKTKQDIARALAAGLMARPNYDEFK